jgi:hypothetical protein
MIDPQTDTHQGTSGATGVRQQWLADASRYRRPFPVRA